MLMTVIYINLQKPGPLHLHLLGALGGGTSSDLTGKVAEGIKKAAAELSANKGAGTCCMWKQRSKYSDNCKCNK